MKNWGINYMGIMGKRKIFITMLVALMLVIAGCSSDSAKPKEEKPTSTSTKTSGGELRVALSAQPPTLDQPTTTSTSTRDIGRLMFETLLTINSSFEAVPVLAESVDVSDDGKLYTFHLRKGVKFHNGKEMTSEDVVASMYRWLEKSSITGAIFDGATFEAGDDYTVVLELAKPSALTLDTMASAKMSAAIMPKEIVEAATEEGVSEYIGTGPFKLVEWKTDQYIHFAKYDDYQSAEGEADGLAGKKEALVDDLYFDFVADAGTRLAGLKTGEYDIAYAMQYDSYEQLLDDPKIDPVLEKVGEFVLVYNKVEGPASNVKMRQAINAAINIEEIMLAAYTNKDIYWLDPGYMTRDIVNWKSDAGSKFYNENDQAKAKKLLKEIGYNNEEFKLMTTRDYPHFYNAAVVIQDQLKNIGINVKLEVFDWPTLADKQNKPGDWDAFITSFGTVTTPTQLLTISPIYAGGVNNDTIIDLAEKIGSSSTQEEAKQLWDELQGYAWEHHMPVSILGGYNALYGESSKVKGFYSFQGGVYWNVSLEE